jgi:HD-GYP domain-containing protein (c-di-GMP phosphodiesterase class II)
MTSDRPYGLARSVASALEELSSCAGSQFDPAVVAAFHEEIVASSASPAHC